ncbi:MAG: DegQ family serine endoprotease [Spirochaetes bacterium]|nr:DegQ family serine endoprotease [Spirochaetota bacterium]
MKKIFYNVSLIIFLVPALLYAVSDLEKMNNDLQKVTEKVLPAVVSISVEKAPVAQSGNFLFNGIPRNMPEQKFFGSGVIISDKGYIVTNNHVVENALKIEVTLYDRKNYEAQIIGIDPATDIAVIRIKGAVPSKLPVISFADSDKIKPGQIVIAIGNPMGFSHTVTMGIISAIQRENLGLADYENLIQTDAAINPGNSGGALVDIYGKLIGINTAIVSRSGGNMGLGFSIPSNMIKKISDQLIGTGSVERGWLGVSIQELTPELAEKFKAPKVNGALISETLKDSPAEKSGIKAGDIITGVNGKDLTGMQDLRRKIADLKPGTIIKLQIFRDGKKTEIPITITKMPVKNIAQQNAEITGDMGLLVEDLNEDLAYRFGIREKYGVVVTGIKNNSPAQKSGIRPGDLIVKMDEINIRNKNDFYRTVEELKKNDSILLMVKRSGSQFFVLMNK